MLSPVRLSSVCLLYLCLGNASVEVEIFGNISTAFSTMATYLCSLFTEIKYGNNL